MKERSLDILVDPGILFGQETSFQTPTVFAAGRALSFRGQRTESCFASAFSYTPLSIKPGESANLFSYYGQAGAWPAALAFRQRVQASAMYGELKREENASVLSQVTDAFAIHTGSPALDAYSRQTYLDNVLRGG